MDGNDTDDVAQARAGDAGEVARLAAGLVLAGAAVCAWPEHPGPPQLRVVLHPSGESLWAAVEAAHGSSPSSRPAQTPHADPAL